MIKRFCSVRGARETGIITMRTLLISILLVLSFLLGDHFAPDGLRRALAEEHKKVISLSEQLHNEVRRNVTAKCAIEAIYADVKKADDKHDSIDYYAETIYQRYCSTNPVVPPIVDADRKQPWDKAVQDMKSQLASCRDWFDTVAVLSSWLYQHTRVGDSRRYGSKRVLGAYDNGCMDIEKLYDINNSDSVAGNCGFHCNYAVALYDYFGIRSFCYSVRPAPSSIEGHMFNAVQNPHNLKWYWVDNFFGIRYRYQGTWLDTEKYFELAGREACEIDVETFGTFKFHIQESPFVEFNSTAIDHVEIISAERSNYPNHFRIVAPFTLRKQFSHRHFRSLFDSIATCYHQPPHTDWIDLARRMPMYGARLFSPLKTAEQPCADSLLISWKRALAY